MSDIFANIKPYEESRYERLLETVAEYMDDTDASSRKFLDDLQKACLELKQHHATALDGYNHVQDFFN